MEGFDAIVQALLAQQMEPTQIQVDEMQQSPKKQMADLLANSQAPGMNMKATPGINFTDLIAAFTGGGE